MSLLWEEDEANTPVWKGAEGLAPAYRGVQGIFSREEEAVAMQAV